jgi:NADH dehydrogenase [ubiquinone] 1 alpha subcomplex assembly factor 7
VALLSAPATLPPTPLAGTLMADLLRGTAAFSQFAAALRVSMVEVSPHLRGMQWRALRCPGLPPEAEADEGASAADQRHHGDASSSSISSSGSPSEEAVAAAWSGVSGWNGSRVRWHRSLEEVATAEGEPALFIAHEFLDALPVHQFQKTGAGCINLAAYACCFGGAPVLLGMFAPLDCWLDSLPPCC